MTKEERRKGSKVLYHLRERTLPRGGKKVMSKRKNPVMKSLPKCVKRRDTGG